MPGVNSGAWPDHPSPRIRPAAAIVGSPTILLSSWSWSNASPAPAGEEREDDAADHFFSRDGFGG